MKYTPGTTTQGVTHKGDIFPNKAVTLGELQDLKLLAKDQPSPQPRKFAPFIMQMPVPDNNGQKSREE